MSTSIKPHTYNANPGKLPGPDTGVEIRKTICHICNPVANCGIDAYVRDGVVIKVEGSEENPHNRGTLCSKGSASRQYVYHQDRILHPMIRKGNRGSGSFQPISWEEALDQIAERLIRIKEETGPESVVFYVGFCKWMRPFLKRLTHGFGSPNYCTESSVCAEAARIAAALNYGAFGTPEFDKMKCLLLWSRNPFWSCSAMVDRILTAKEKRGMKIIEVGPLITPMTAHADIHLRIRPGTSGALALGMADVIIKEGLYDREFVEKYTLGFEEFRGYVRQFSVSETERITGVPGDLLIKAARLYAGTKPAGMWNGASPTVHHTNGVQNHRAITALVGLTGNYDREGGNYVTSSTYLHIWSGLQTRENAFEQTLPWEDMPPRVGQDVFPVWSRIVPQGQSMHIPFQIRTKKPYPLRAMLCFGLNYRMWPGSDFFKESLNMLDFVVDIDLFMTDSARMADIVLPACSSFERSELNFYPEGYGIWTEPVIAPLGQSRSDVDIIRDLATRLTPEDTLLQSGYEACLDWIFEPSGLTMSELKKHPKGYTVKDPVVLPYQKYETRGFNTPSGKMEFASTILKEAGVDPLPVYQEPKLSPLSKTDTASEYPLILTTGARLPMFVHSRTFRLEWTRRLRPHPMVDINPRDARNRGILALDEVTLSTNRGSIRVKANLTETVPPGVVSMMYGYPEADVNELIEPDYVDPISGFPGFKSLLCEITKITD